MWQDALALLIVALAVLMLVRIYAPNLRIFGKRSAASAPTTNPNAASYTPGCAACSSRSSCSSAKK